MSFPNPDYDPQAASNAEGSGEIYPVPKTIEFMAGREDRWFIPTGLYWAVDRWCMREGVDLGLVGDWPPWIADPEAHMEQTKELKVPPDLIPGSTLRDYQREAIEEVLRWRRGVLEIATGGGKTEIAMGVVLAYLRTRDELGRLLDKPEPLRTLYLVPDTKAMETSWKRFQGRGIDAGRLGDKNRELDCPVLIAVVNSLYNGIKTQDPEILEWFQEAEIYICDEAHHQGTALSWKMISAYVQAEYRICLSGTPFKNNEVRTDPAILDPYDSWLIGLSGRVLVHLSPKELISRGALSPGVFVSFQAAKPDRNLMSIDWYPEVYKQGIEENPYRNAQVCQLAANLSHMGRKPLVSVEKLEHGRNLQRLLLREHQVPAACSYGSGVVYLPIEVAEAAGAAYELAPIMKRRKRKVKGKMKWVTEQVGEEPDIARVEGVDVDQLLLEGVVRVLIGSKIFDEAQDIPWLTDMINAAGGKASQRLRQKIGRILRKHDGKQVAWFWDPWDESHYYLLNHSKKRLAIATEEGYPTITDWTLASILTRDDVSKFCIGEPVMKLKEIEVTVALTIPMSLPNSDGYVYIKPAVTLRGELEEGDDPTIAAQELHNRAMGLFLVEAHRQAAEGAQVATRQDGFSYAQERARQYLELFQPKEPS
jgi:superfamily II DNA or RNA helicase